MNDVQIITGEPTISVIAEMKLNDSGVQVMSNWVGSHRPECLPDKSERDRMGITGGLFPHGGLREGSDEYYLSDNELLVELAGRTCYHSYGLKAGKKTNREYIANTQAGEIKHSSIMYHAKMTFFIAGVSRRVSHELIRNYVGADRSEEGSPSQESTRFTHHYGWFVAPPRIVDRPMAISRFRDRMQGNYDSYLEFIADEISDYKNEHRGEDPKGMDRKRIYEAASHFLSHSAETSFVWTTNPMALTKLFRERCDAAADLEFRRFADEWKAICIERWPNLFPAFH